MECILAIANGTASRLSKTTRTGCSEATRGSPSGTFGCLATQSFHETKNVSCGEGGALVINDSRYTRAGRDSAREGHQPEPFLPGQVDKYTWVDVGSSYLPSDLLAAFLYAQLEEAEEIQNRRKRIWKYYRQSLEDWAACHAVRLPVVPKWCAQSYHMFYMILPSLEVRQALIAHLKERGILSVFHYVPLHLSDMGRRWGGREGQCPVTERTGECLLRLPFYNDLTEADQASVVSALREFDGWPHRN